MDKIRGVVLSGGGAKGAYQVGVLTYMASAGFRGFHIYSGTSVGAINSYWLAHFPIEEFLRGVVELENLWLDKLRSNRSVYRYCFPKYLYGACHPHLVTVKSLERLIKGVANEGKVRESGIKLLLTAVDILTGELTVFDEHTPDIFDAVMASASMPGAMPLWECEGRLYTDGGVRDIAPLSHCIKAGAEQIVTIHTDCETAYKYPPKNMLEMLNRVIDFMTREILVNDLAKLDKINTEVTAGKKRLKRHIEMDVISPSENLGDSMDFDPKLTKWRMELGRKDAREYFKGAR